MTRNPKPRGRPQGTEIDDNAVLMAIADRILAEPHLRPTTAHRKINPMASDAVVRRVQAKWKARGAAMLAKARTRRAELAGPLCAAPARRLSGREVIRRAAMSPTAFDVPRRSPLSFGKAPAFSSRFAAELAARMSLLSSQLGTMIGMSAGLRSVTGRHHPASARYLPETTALQRRLRAQAAAIHSLTAIKFLSAPNIFSSLDAAEEG